MKNSLICSYEQVRDQSLILFVVIDFFIMEGQTQDLFAELIRQALFQIHSGNPDVNLALYKAINVLQEQNILENVASSLQ